MREPLSIHHVAVVVRDLARAEVFYAGVLGLPVVKRWADDAGEPRSVWFDLGSSFLAVERAAVEGPTRADEAPGWHCVALGIAPGEREEWRRRLAGAGVRIERESPYSMYACDPDGNWLAFSHYPHARIGAT
jgi:catechol 2,3-dioxygenase-like lactoylglutathione lyase family enzyme